MHTLIISFTRSLIRHPKLFIFIPILIVFLVSYDTFYKIALFDSTHWIQLSIHSIRTGEDALLGHQVRAPKFECSELGYNITRLTFKVRNALSAENLQSLLSFEKSLPNNSYVLSPLSLLLPSWRSTLEFSDHLDKQTIDKSLLKLFNYKVPCSILTIFLGKWQKFNQIIVSAREFSVYIFSHSSPTSFLPSDLLTDKMVNSVTEGPKNAVSFLNYYYFLLEDAPRVRMANILMRTIVLVALTMFAIHLYLSVCNCHKIRSSIGLLIGWAASSITAYFAALDIRKQSNSSLLLLSVFGPARWQLNESCILCIMLMSSRTFYRTLHDLAGDSTFGEPESLHKRVIKYYLGINISEKNSKGVFWMSQFLKSFLMLNNQEVYPIPIPNITFILLINLCGFSITFGVSSLIMSVFLTESTLSLYWGVVYEFYMVITVTLIIDHALQLTFLAAIVIIDLNKVELSDMLSQRAIENESIFHEVNPISAILFRSNGHETPKGSLRHYLGTYFLKISPSSLRTYWMYIMPLMCISIAGITSLLINLAFRDGISSDLIKELVFLRNYTDSEENTYIYYLELVLIVIFIVVICELCLSVNFSRIKGDDVAIAFESETAGDDQAVFFHKLLDTKGSKRFECLTLENPSGADLLKLYSNSKCSYIVSVDMDHRYLLWQPKKGSELNIPIELEPNFEMKGKGSSVVNHVEISDGGDFVILMNFQACRIKCFNTTSRSFTWEVSLTSEVDQPVKRMKTVATFFRKRTVIGLLARTLLLRKRNSSRRGSEGSIMSNHSWSGNFLPPMATNELNEGGTANEQNSEKLHKEEFIAILETGEMVVIMCNEFKIQLFNLLDEAFQGHEDRYGLTIVSLKFLASARVSDKIVCNLSNNDIIVGTAIKNTWRFHKLELNKVFKPHTLATFAPPLMSRGYAPNAFSTDMSTTRDYTRYQLRDIHIRQKAQDSTIRMNKPTVVTIEFVGMFVRVKELTAEMVDILTGTILRVFYIGSFKPGTFRVAHSEPTHCKFCGCASVESLTLLYEDLYEKTVILHTFKLQNAKSRNNICLRVERDPREVRCMGLDSAIESHYWYTNVEQWELTDMNVIIGIKKDAETCEQIPKSVFDSEVETLSVLRSRKRKVNLYDNGSKENIRWQGFVVTALNGKFLEYEIPGDDFASTCSTRPNYIVKYGFKAVAVVTGSLVKVLYLGNDKLIENDLYFSGTTSSLNPILLPGSTGKTQLSDLLFINKRRGNRFRMPSNDFHGAVKNAS